MSYEVWQKDLFYNRAFNSPSITCMTLDKAMEDAKFLSKKYSDIYVLVVRDKGKTLVRGVARDGKFVYAVDCKRCNGKYDSENCTACNGGGFKTP